MVTSKVGFIVFFMISLLLTSCVPQTSNSVTQYNPQGSLPTPTIEALPSQQLAVWLPWWNTPVLKKSLETLNTERIQILSPLWYQTTTQGTLVPYPVQSRADLDSLLEQTGVVILPTIGNDFDPKRVTLLLSDSSLRKQFIDEMITLADRYGYVGWDFDWEEVAASDATSYVRFLSEVKAEFAQHNLELIVTVHARTGKNDWEGAKGHDFATLAKVADYIRIMAYDFHHGKSRAGPVSPLDWYEDVLEYALEKIPVEKIVVGLPLYGYDWVESKGESVTYDEAQRRILLAKVTPQRDAVSGVMHTRYIQSGVTHEMWWEDNVSVQTKIKIAQEYGLNSFVFWSLGGEDPQVFAEMN